MKLLNSLLFLVCLMQMLAGSNGERLWQQISGSDHQFSQYCDFSLWDELGYHPEYRDTCTYKHFTWAWENKDGDCCTWEKTEHTSSKPWCPSKTGGGVTDWQYCTFWRWQYEVNNNFLGQNYKKYEYGFLHRNRWSYRYARSSCLEKGVGWDLASFQTMFNTSLGEIYQDDNYFQSMDNLRSILDTMKAKKYQYPDSYQFWVRNDQSFMGMDKYERAKNLHYTARNCLVYDFIKDTIKFERCDNDEKEFLVVCEYDWKVTY